MSHNHSHSHNHGQGASNIKVAFLLNFSFAILEIVGGTLTNSTAILSDAVHDLGDSLALAFSYFAEKVSKKEATKQYNYGFKRLSLIGAIVNILVLSIGTAYVLKEAVQALLSPQEVNSEGMLLLAIIGIAVNGFSVFRMKGSKKILDKTVMMHLLEDLLGWVAVFIVSIVIFFTNWYILDPILSIFIAFVVLRNVWMNSKQAYNILMQAVPDGELYKNINEILIKLDEIKAIKDFKMWSLDGDDHVVTLCLIINKESNHENIRRKIKEMLIVEGIDNSTLEFIVE